MNSNSMELNIQRFAEGGSDGGSSESATVAQSQETGENGDVSPEEGKDTATGESLL